MRQQAAVAAKVFIQRDYTNGTVCQFQTKFPSELETRIDKQQFEETVRTLNNLYAEAEKLGSQSYIEGCLACLTAYTVFLCMETHYEKVLKKIAKYIQEQNDKIYAPRGLLLTDPIERGLRVIEVTIFEDRKLAVSSPAAAVSRTSPVSIVTTSPSFSKRIFREGAWIHFTVPLPGVTRP
ncbi:golgin subfamily A member 7-like isoform X2 [Enoplosus armatus]|uniref:golgin subfamily A member 7-like isoform X2 n=1 Tax=Enoplosus armatus TaxID=215367 RepID=UPI00399383DC